MQRLAVYSSKLEWYTFILSEWFMVNISDVKDIETKSKYLKNVFNLYFLRNCCIICQIKMIVERLFIGINGEILIILF